jgi:putative transposase
VREDPPSLPLSKPEAARYHLVRFIRSDRRLDVFGERFLLPLEAQYQHVVATVHVEHQRLRVMLGKDLVAEFPYRLR